MTPEQALLAVLGVLGLPAATSALITYLLNRKGANRRLQVDETTAEDNRYASQLNSYDKLVERIEEAATRAEQAATDAVTAKNNAEKAAADAEKENSELRESVKELKGRDLANMRTIAEVRSKLETLRLLFMEYRRRVGVPMTEEEMEKFERTRPTAEVLADPEYPSAHDS